MPAEASSRLHRIVIVGGGAGGLELAARLGDKLGRRGKAMITLVDAAFTHLWKPLLYEVAAGTLGSDGNEIDFLQQARRHCFRFHPGRFEHLDRARRQIWLAPLADEGVDIAPRRPLDYDTAVIAIGAIDNDFGTPGVQRYAHKLNSMDDAQHFRRRLLALCARADLGSGHPVRVVIVGGGATGVELAAELAGAAREIATYGMQLEQLRQPLRITVVEASPRLLGAIPQAVAQRAHEMLVRRAIEVRVAQAVAEVDAGGVVLTGGGRIDADLVVWAAGVQGQKLLDTLDGLAINRQRQLLVRSTLQTTKDDNVFAFGDCASCLAGNGKGTVPPTAQTAQQQARLLTSSLSRRVDGQVPLAFRYRERGNLVTLGSHQVIGNLEPAGVRDFTISGFPARFSYWLLYRRHLALLLGIPHTLLLTIGQRLSRPAQPRASSCIKP